MADPIKISNSKYFEKYKEHLRKRESGGKVNAKTLSVFNRLGYLGLYQMGVKALIDAGMLNEKAKQQWNNRENLGLSQKDIISNNDNWTKGNSYDKFITDEKLQEKALKTYTDKNYNAIKNTLKSKGINGQDVFSYLTGAHLSGAGNIKKYINGGNKEWTDKNGTSIENYINSYRKSANIKIPNPKSKEPKKLTDAESYSAYSKFKKEVAEENKKLKEQGKDYQSTHTKNVREIYKKYQNKYGSENLKKGAQLVSEENKYVFENDNKHYQKIKSLEKQKEKILRDKSKKPDQKEIDSIDRKIQAGYANIRLEANKEKMKSLQEKMDDSEFGSNDYLEAEKEYDKLEEQNNTISSGFKQKKITLRSIDKVNKDKFKNENLIFKNEVDNGNSDPKSKRIGTKSAIYYDPNIYEGKNDFSDINDLYQVEEFKPLNFDEDNENDSNGDNDYIDYTPEEDSDNTKKDNSDYNFDFFEGEPERASVYQDDIDNEAKQSVGGYLKENPMAVLSAALGVKGLIDSQTELPDIDVKDQTALSDSFYEYLNNLETISKKGFTPEEEANYLKQINDGYMASVDLAVQASGGNRAKVLSQAGKLNANKNDALLSFASQDAQLQRQNLEKYGQALQYKEAFNERKDTRMQSNEYNRQRAEFERASNKRKGGAALAAGSIKSLVNSIRDYKETGEGSVLDNYRKYMANKIKSEGIKINPDTGKPFQNAEEESNYYANQKDLNSKYKTAALDFGRNLKLNSNLTKPDKDYIYQRTKNLGKKEMVDFLNIYDLKTGPDGLKRILDPVEKSSLKDEMDFSSLEKPITEDLAKENIYNDFT